MWSHSRTLLVRKVNQIKSEMTTVPFDPPSIGTGLPQHPTSFVGRHHELREIRRLLGDHRLVSVVGPGGIGKTRLVVRAAEEYRRAFADGIRFVELASLRSESLVSQAIADRLGLETRDGPNNSADDILVEYLRNRRMLLILDNCEHLVDGVAALVSRLTEETRNLRILTTSREYLAIPGEYVFHLPPLSIDGGKESGAVELFANRAESVLSGFELSDSNVDAVRRICQRLDGLPLAIELACTRLNVLSVEDLAERLDRRLSMLTVSARGRTPRHRSLQATIDWSYELCSETERILWCHTSVFADSFDIGMAVAVCSDDALSEDEIMEAVAALVAKSVVVREISDNGVRFRLLESIREYGWGKLTIPERRHMNERLLEYCARIVEESTTSWYGPEQLTKATAVSINRGNIRAALHSVMNTPTDPALVELAADTLGSSRFLWACGISVREHRMWLTQALDLPGVSRTARGRILTVLALVQTLQGDRDAADFTLRRHASSPATAKIRSPDHSRSISQDCGTSSPAERIPGWHTSTRQNADINSTAVIRNWYRCCRSIEACCSAPRRTYPAPPMLSAECSPVPTRSANSGSTPTRPTDSATSHCSRTIRTPLPSARSKHFATNESSRPDRQDSDGRPSDGHSPSKATVHARGRAGRGLIHVGIDRSTTLRCRSLEYLARTRSRYGTAPRRRFGIRCRMGPRPGHDRPRIARLHLRRRLCQARSPCPRPELLRPRNS